MKKNVLLFALMFVSFSVMAQTNTFPADGNVGIGTTGPDQKLTIKGGGIGFDGNSADKKLYAPNDGVLEWMTHDWAGEHAFAVSHQGQKRIYLNTNGNSYLIGGNIGIGTTSPSRLLDLYGNGAWNSTGGIRLQGNNPGIEIRDLSSGQSWLMANGVNNGSDGYLGLAYNFSTGTHNIVVTNTTNVGIGTTNPQYKLDILSPHGGGINNNNIYSSSGDSHYFIVNKQAISYYGGYSSTRMNVGTGFSEVQIGSSNLSQSVNLMVTGNILIGKTSQSNTSYKLDVAGNIRANKLVVNTTGADYVFDSSYSLTPLTEVETFINQNKHLPGIEPAKQMSEEGVDVGNNQTKLLQKIEELTLYMIEIKKENEQMKKENENQQKEIDALKKKQTK